MADSVTASEFTQNFGNYRTLAERGAIPVSKDGEIAGYFVSSAEYEALLRFRAQRRSFATAELSAERVRAIGSSRMDKRHDHLDALLD